MGWSQFTLDFASFWHILVGNSNSHLCWCPKFELITTGHVAPSSVGCNYVCFAEVPLVINNPWKQDCHHKMVKPNQSIQSIQSIMKTLYIAAGLFVTMIPEGFPWPKIGNSCFIIVHGIPKHLTVLRLPNVLRKEFQGEANKTRVSAFNTTGFTADRQMATIVPKTGETGFSCWASGVWSMVMFLEVENPMRFSSPKERPGFEESSTPIRKAPVFGIEKNRPAAWLKCFPLEARSWEVLWRPLQGMGWWHHKLGLRTVFSFLGLFEVTFCFPRGKPSLCGMICMFYFPSRCLKQMWGLGKWWQTIHFRALTVEMRRANQADTKPFVMLRPADRKKLCFSSST